MLVDPGRTQRFLVVRAHLNGSGVVWSGRSQVAASPSHIVVNSPEEPLRMSLSADTELVLVKIESATVERALRDLLRDDPDRPIQFDLGKYDKPFANAWAERFEDWLISKLLLPQHSNYSEGLSRIATQPVRARSVVDAAELVRADPSPWWTASSLAAVLDAGLVRLESGFECYRGVSVAGFLLRERLRAVRRLLQDSDPDEIQLADVARYWGFRDQLAFVTNYNAVFGETPDQTLRS